MRDYKCGRFQLEQSADILSAMLAAAGIPHVYYEYDNFYEIRWGWAE